MKGKGPEGPQFEFRHAIERQRLAPSVEGAIFRIVQEAVTNAERHSQSTRIRIVGPRCDIRKARIQMHRLNTGKFGLDSENEFGSLNISTSGPKLS